MTGREHTLPRRARLSTHPEQAREQRTPSKRTNTPAARASLEHCTSTATGYLEKKHKSGRRDRMPTTTKGGLSLWSALCIVSWLPSSIFLSARNRNTGMIIDGKRARENTIFRREMGFRAPRLGSGSGIGLSVRLEKRGPARRVRCLTNRAGSAAARTEVGSDPAAR